MSQVIKCQEPGCGKEIEVDEVIKEWEKSKRNLWVEHIDGTGHKDFVMVNKKVGGGQ